MSRKNFILAVILMTIALLPCAVFGADATPPASPVKLIFIHHSTGGNWLADPDANPLGGGLGIALKNNNYYVSATNYGWGPDGIGDRTDIVNWTEWFTGENSAVIMNAVYSETAQNIGDFGSWQRLATAPGGENTIVMFKSCFPNSDLHGNPDDPAASEPNQDYSVSNAKAIYNNLLNYFRTRQDKLFVVITAPPLASAETDASRAANARAFNNWLVNDWLKNYPYRNVAVFDFYNVLTSNGGNPDTNDAGQESGNHHRWHNGSVQYIQTLSNNTSSYPSGDSHPTAAGGQKAAAEFVPLLNYFYNLWKEDTRPVNNCITVTDDLKLNISVLYHGLQYGFALDYTPVSVDPSGFYWKADISTFSQVQRDPAACIPLSDDLRLNVCAQYRGINFEFSLDYTPVSEDASGFYWKADIGTFRQK